MEDNAEYVRREVVHIRVDQEDFIERLNEHQAEQVILQWGSESEYPERRDIGQLCYLDRKQTSKFAKVNLTSLCEIRKSHVRKILNSALYRSREHISYMRNFIDYIDFEYHDFCDFDKKLDLKKAYVAYTRHLQHRLNQSKIKKSEAAIGSKVASRRQHGAIMAISCLIDSVSESAIQTWAPKISRKDKEDCLPSIRQSNKHYARMFAIHLHVFDQISDFILEEKLLPLELDMSGLDMPYNKIFVWTNRMNSENIYEKSDWRYWGVRGRELLGWSELSSLAAGEGIRMNNSQKTYHREFKNDLRTAEGKPTQKRLQTLANIAVNSFSFALIADSGANWAVLREVDFDNPRFVKELEKTRLISVKKRAGSKNQDVSISVRFKPFFQKYLKLRKWMGVEQRYGIFQFGMNGDLKLQALKANAKGIRSRLEYLLMAEVPWVNARDWRWNLSYEYLKASNGDVRMVARVLGNGTNQVRKHYGFADFETSAMELSTFFKELTFSARKRARKFPEKVIPVKIDDAAPGIVTGGCTGTTVEDATLAEGFTNDVPQPSCGTPVTCFMCDKYALHINEDDFRKVLSAKYWLMKQGLSVSINSDEYLAKYQPLIERIDEILEQGAKQSDEAKKISEKITKEVKLGQYDSYWKIHIDALIDGGYL
ncbi:hypothetical protein A3759_06135 [Thalassolituus sp. HI0120]|nr:hypothetical protein A3759_06135 [Thalassolituus sp. HI0120]